MKKRKKRYNPTKDIIDQTKLGVMTSVGYSTVARLPNQSDFTIRAVGGSFGALNMLQGSKSVLKGLKSLEDL